MKDNNRKNFMSGKHWIIGLIIILFGYNFIKEIRNLILAKRSPTNWVSGDRQILIDKCIIESGQVSKEYPDLIKTYCECSNELIMRKFNKQEYLEIDKKSIEEKEKIMLPVFQECLTEFRKSIKEEKK